MVSSIKIPAFIDIFQSEIWNKMATYSVRGDHNCLTIVARQMKFDTWKISYPTYWILRAVIISELLYLVTLKLMQSEARTYTMTPDQQTQNSNRS